jgi:hypothetical protein
MARSRTTWLKYPMILSDIMDNDSWKYLLFQMKPNNITEEQAEKGRVTTLICYMRARTTHLGYSVSHDNITMRRGNRNIQLPTNFREAASVIVNEGMLELDVDPYDPELAREAREQMRGEDNGE